jgi:membrane protein YqaA with SNARE-associated domain
MFRYFILPFIWGYAEATFFFIIPDVILGYNAIEDFKKAMAGCIIAVAGALLGGITLYYLTVSFPVEILKALESVPAISNEMISTVDSQIKEKGLWALFLGPLMAIPYKLYVAQAALNPIDLAMFLAISIPARLLRFVLTATGTKILFSFFKDKLDRRRITIIYFILWIVFYTVFFIRMPS